MRQRKEKLCGVYKITAPNGMFYIGASINLRSRISTHKCPSTYRFNKSLIAESIHKYGAENHKYEILQFCKMEELYEIEMIFISEYRNSTPNLMLNIRNGGLYFGKQEQATRDKISLKNKGKVRSDDARMKLSIAGKKRAVRSGRHVLDTETNKEYISIFQASKETGIPINTLKRRLSGICKNDTTLIFKNENK